MTPQLVAARSAVGTRFIQQHFLTNHSSHEALVPTCPPRVTSYIQPALLIGIRINSQTLSYCHSDGPR